MGDGSRLVKAMRNAGKTPQNEVADMIEGTVTSVSPLKVKVENRELTEAFLIQGALVVETHIYTKNIIKHNHLHPTPHGASGQPYSDDFDIMLWRGLKVGDVVWMLKLGRGQKYLILQRKEGVKPT